jgi:hypothetical protein
MTRASRLHGSLPPLPKCPGGALQGHRHQDKIFNCWYPKVRFWTSYPLYNQLSNEQGIWIENLFSPNFLSCEMYGLTSPMFALWMWYPIYNHIKTSLEISRFHRLFMLRWKGFFCLLDKSIDRIVIEQYNRKRIIVQMLINRLATNTASGLYCKSNIASGVMLPGRWLPRHHA